MVKLTTKAYVLAAACLVLATGIYFYQDDSVDYFYLTRQRPVYFSQNDPVAYYYLTLQWPASVCQSSKVKCSKVPGNFTIHGLWAQTKDHKSKDCNTTTSDIEICKKHTFNYEKLKSDKMLMKMMNISWPNLFSTNQRFWERQWTKHGCCIFKSQQNKYFNKTCGMYRKQPSLLEIFKAKNIIPGVQEKYTLKNFTEAIRAGLHVQPGTFKCEENEENETRTKRLVEVKLCTDKEVTKFENCSAREPKTPSCGKVNDSIPIAFPIYIKDDEAVLM